MTIIVTQQQDSWLLLPQLNRHLTQILKSDWFEISFWKKHRSITGQSQGRNVTWFVEHKGNQWVLRHYYRGGMVAKILGDQYLFSNIQNTRCYRELQLLEKMHQQGLPVPKPVAARVVKKGIFYQADLLIEKIPNAEDLVHKLSSEKISETDWHRIGALLAKFHQAGIYHSDLNAHNILLDESFNFWLIDFDKCEHRISKGNWQQSNLKRLHRSFEKETRLYQNFHFNQQCWKWLMLGYQRFYR